MRSSRSTMNGPAVTLSMQILFRSHFYQRTGSTNDACCVAPASGVGTTHHDVTGFVLHFGEFSGLTVRVIRSPQVLSPACCLSVRFNVAAGCLSAEIPSTHPLLIHTQLRLCEATEKLLQLFVFPVNRKSTANYRLLQAITAISADKSTGMRALRRCSFTVYSGREAEAKSSGGV